MANEKNPRKELVDKIINSIKSKDGVWQKAWKNISGGAPFNPISGTQYKGINFLALSLEQTELDTLDSRWCTFKQAVDSGYKITKGSKAAQASFYDLSVKLTNNDKDCFIKAKSIEEYIAKIIDYYKVEYPAKSTAIKGAVDQAAKYITLSGKANLALYVTELNKATGADIKILSTPIMKTFPIFNYSQLENVPRWEIKPGNKFESIHRAEDILAASGAKIFHDNANRNYYNPKQHEIHLTPKESFKNPEAYYSTALHEIAHWTKGDGLSRNFNIDNQADYNSLSYAKEELRAELASIFLSSDLDLKLDIRNHAAYLGSYLEVLSNDYTEFFAAVSDAQKIANHVINFEKRLDLESSESKELQTKNPELYQKIKLYKSEHAALPESWQANNIEVHKFEAGTIYVTKWHGEIRKFEISEVENNRLIVKDKTFNIVQDHSPQSFQHMVNIYECEKVDTISPQLQIDSNYLAQGQELLNKIFLNVAKQNIEGTFIFKSANIAQQFIDKLGSKYDVPGNAIHADNFDRKDKNPSFLYKKDQDYSVDADNDFSR